MADLTPYAKAAFLQGSNPTAAMSIGYKAAESTNDFNFEKGAISKNLLGPIAENALQASPDNPAANQAQRGKAGSDNMQEAYKAVNQFWQGNPDAQFIEQGLGGEDQAKLQQLAFSDPQEYYRELARRKSTLSSQKSWQDMYGPKGKMTNASSGGGGIGAGLAGMMQASPEMMRPSTQAGSLAPSMERYYQNVLTKPSGFSSQEQTENILARTALLQHKSALAKSKEEALKQLQQAEGVSNKPAWRGDVGGGI